MQEKGTITSWNDTKGFGFITPANGGKPVFIHIKAFRDRSNRPRLKQTVLYDISSDRQGRTCAVNAVRPGTKNKTNSSTTKAILFILIFFGVLLVGVLAEKIPALILAVYLALSLLTFIVYAIDKSAAQNGTWRTAESTLHLLALAGGWPGALIAQQKLRHKSRKQPFRAVFWLSVLLNLSVLVWFLTPQGNAVLQPLLMNIQQLFQQFVSFLRNR